jgi:hypothetical protein
MSDVLRYEVAQGLLLTGLINPQIVRTAEMADAVAILMVRGNKPLPETVEVARQVGIPILGTELTMFETCGRLYGAGLPAARRHDYNPGVRSPLGKLRTLPEEKLDSPA